MYHDPDNPYTCTCVQCSRRRVYAASVAREQRRLYNDTGQLPHGLSGEALRRFLDNAAWDRRDAAELANELRIHRYYD